MAANARDHSLNIYEVCCINVRGRLEFPIEEELSKLPIAKSYVPTLFFRYSFLEDLPKLVDN